MEIIYRRTYELVYAGLHADDEDERELALELAKTALAYTQIRTEWSWYSMEEKMATDSGRTVCHNHLIDCFNMFFRYEKAHGKDAPDFSEYNRKIIGDIGNHLVCDLAISQR